MSCVRSNEHQGIGFLKDPRRLNVAITRCRYGLVILGNARVLAKSPLWNALLSHFKHHQCLVEGPISSLTECMISFAPPKAMRYGASTMMDFRMASSAGAEAFESRMIPAPYQSGQFNSADAGAKFVPTQTPVTTEAPSLMGVTPDSSSLSLQTLALGMTDMSLGLTQSQK